MVVYFSGRVCTGELDVRRAPPCDLPIRNRVTCYFWIFGGVAAQPTQLDPCPANGQFYCGRRQGRGLCFIGHKCEIWLKWKKERLRERTRLISTFPSEKKLARKIEWWNGSAGPIHSGEDHDSFAAATTHLPCNKYVGPCREVLIWTLSDVEGNLEGWTEGWAGSLHLTCYQLFGKNASSAYLFSV